MTVEAPSRPQPQYTSRWGLLDFQQEGVIHSLLGPTLAVWDTGLGKGHLAMATSVVMFDEGMIDVHLVVCEQNKIEEWIADFGENTTLDVIPYGGANQLAEHRRRIAEALRTGEPTQVKRGWKIERPQVLVATYETLRNDMARTETITRGKRKVKALVPSFFTEALLGKKVLISYDEMTKIGNRNVTHNSHALFIAEVRKSGGTVHVQGLTATPIERDPENYYNLGRILCPSAVGTVASFDKEHVVYRDAYHRATVFKNLTPTDVHREPWVTPLSEKMGKVIHRKRWTDDDVRSRFPEVAPEKFVHVRLDDRHQEFYEAVRDVLAETAKSEEEERQSFTLLRMIAGLPISLVHSDSKAAKTIVREVGEDGLRALGSAKLDVLTDRLKTIVLGQGAQAVVFTFFGPSMIPYIAERLEEKGITVAQNYPDLGDKTRAQHRAEFKAGERRVFLSSDAGARGINLPQASYAIEYEAAITHSRRVQRLNRTKRIDSREYGIEHIYFQTLIAVDTVEEGIMNGVLRRNTWADRLLDDDDTGEHFVTAEQRKRLLAIGRKAV